MTTPNPRLLGGRYELGELIGRGGMAEVHRGYDTRLGRPVAVKILRSDHARDASFLHRFRREAQSVAGLNHRSIVAVYDSGEDRVTESGGADLAVPYIVMELVEGKTLREVLNEDGVLAPDEAARVCEGVLDALAYSHRMGIVHRDIKPGNVMLGEDGSVKVMDFGIARAVADAQATMTQTATVVGTAQYVSPEQARGETVDHRSDIYSVGCLLFELLTGTTPYTGEPISLTYQHVNAPVPLPSSLEPDVPQELDAVVAAALTKDRDERYQDAGDMADDLRSYRQGGPVSALAAGALTALLGGPTRSGAAADPTVALTAVPDPHVGDTSTLRPVPAPAPVPGPIVEREPERRRGGGWGWLLALLLLIPLALLGWYAWQASQPEPTRQVSVPKLVGVDEATAEARLKEVGLDGDASEENNPADKGTVFRQGTPEGRTVDEGTTIEYTVSLGPGEVAVPQLTGKSLGEAKQDLSDAGLKAGDVSYEDSNEQKANRVISASPGEGETVETGSTVDLVVASGKVQLGDYVGQDVDTASQAIYGLGLKVTVVREESDQPEGQVLRQEPGAGAIAQGRTVRLYVAQAPTQTVTKTETPTSTTTPPTSSTTTSDPTSTSSPTTPTATPSTPTRPDPSSTAPPTP